VPAASAHTGVQRLGELRQCRATGAHRIEPLLIARQRTAAAARRNAMGLLLKDPLHDGFASWALGYAPYGGADPGEIVAIVRAIGDGDDSAWYDAWTATANRLVEQGAACIGRAQRRSAREFYLHAASFYSFSYRPLFGEPIDARLTAAFRK
jgi:hypothetical protein